MSRSCDLYTVIRTAVLRAVSRSFHRLAAVIERPETKGCVLSPRVLTRCAALPMRQRRLFPRLASEGRDTRHRCFQPGPGTPFHLAGTGKTSAGVRGPLSLVPTEGK